MANQIVAGNSSNGGTAISTDTSGTLNIVTGSGSGATAVTVDGSGNMVVTGTLSASGGVSGSITSGTAVSASGTSVNFTSIPSNVKRITVMLSGLSTNGSSNLLIQLGDSGGIEATGYLGSGNNSATGVSNYTTGFGSNLMNDPSAVLHGSLTIQKISGNSWVASGALGRSDGASIGSITGSKTLSDILDRVRITTVNGTDTFDVGTINIFYE